MELEAATSTVTGLTADDIWESSRAMELLGATSGSGSLGGSSTGAIISTWLVNSWLAASGAALSTCEPKLFPSAGAIGLVPKIISAIAWRQCSAHNCRTGVCAR